MLGKILKDLISGADLDFETAKVACESLFDHDESDYRKVSLLTLLSRKLLTSIEFKAFYEVMLKFAKEVDETTCDVIDVCGTGGDGKNTFNISTTVAFLLAASGIKVAKHGNYSSSSICGSSNVLEDSGVIFYSNLDQAKESIEKNGIAYLHAPLFHPALKDLSKIRKAIGFRTIFNLLGPLANPFLNCKRLCGIANNSDILLYREFLDQKENDFYLVHSFSGYDEISLTSDFKIVGKNSNKMVEEVFSPSALGYNSINPQSIFGGENIATAKEIFTDILKGKGSKEQNAVVVANALFGYRLFYPNESIQNIKEKLTEVLLSGSAYEKLKLLTK